MKIDGFSTMISICADMNDCCITISKFSYEYWNSWEQSKSFFEMDITFPEEVFELIVFNRCAQNTLDNALHLNNVDPVP